MKNRAKSSVSVLRHDAEELLKKGNTPSSPLSAFDTSLTVPLSNAETQKLIYELEVHRIELEMQNEELNFAIKVAEEATEKYTKLFDFAPSGYFALSKVGEIIDLNLRGAAILGRPRSLLKNSRFGFFVNNETRSAFNLFLETTFNTKENGFCELTLTTDENNTVYLYLTGMVDENEEFCLITAVDITASKQAVILANTSENKYRTIFNNIQDVFYQTDLSGVILEISPSISKFSEFERNEIIGNSVQGLYYNPLEWESFLNALLNKGELHDYELKIKTKSGKIKIVSINAQLNFDAYGFPDHIDGSMRDITRRKEAELEVKKLQKAIENSNASIVITDTAGNIEYANPYFTKLTGFTREECIGQNPKVLKSGYHSNAFYRELWDTINSGKTWEGEFYNRKKNGLYFWENAIISPVQNDQNEITHFVAIKTDITAAKKINEELINAKLRAEESDNLKTAFLNNISHEIRTPFNGILGFLSILQNDDLTKTERNEYTKIINESATRLMNTITDITEISEIQAGQIKIAKSVVNLSKLTEGLIERFSNVLNKKGLSFKVRNTLPAKMDTIYTDQLKLKTILNNLVSNAIKFTNAGSIELTIGLKCDLKGKVESGRNLRPEPDSTMLEFAVKDSGIGIPKNKQLSIFDRFIQADSSNTRRFEGSGLGTTIAKAYVEMLGGRISLTSTEGKGSTFRFTISCYSEPEERRFIAQETSAGEGLTDFYPLKILIAEDDDASAMLAKLIMKPFYREVLLVKNGLDAVEACRLNPDIDLVLMDIRMPIMNGYVATNQIRQFNPKVVIIAQTAHALTADFEQAIASGCNDHITKPIQKVELITLVQKYFKLKVK